MDPDEPTRPVRPADPRPREPRPAAYAPPAAAAPVAADPYAAGVGWQDALDRLRTWLTALTVVSLAALALAVYDLATRDNDNGGGSSSGRSSRVSELQDRVGSLEGKVEGRATKGDVQDVQDAVGKLDARVAAVEKSASSGSTGGADTAQVSQQVSQLSGRVDQLSQKVDDLAAQQQQQGDTQP